MGWGGSGIGGLWMVFKPGSGLLRLLPYSKEGQRVLRAASYRKHKGLSPQKGKDDSVLSKYKEAKTAEELWGTMKQNKRRSKGVIW